MNDKVTPKSRAMDSGGFASESLSVSIVDGQPTAGHIPRHLAVVNFIAKRLARNEIWQAHVLLVPIPALPSDISKLLAIAIEGAQAAKELGAGTAWNLRQLVLLKILHSAESRAASQSFLSGEGGGRVEPVDPNRQRHTKDKASIQDDTRLVIPPHFMEQERPTNASLEALLARVQTKPATNYPLPPLTSDAEHFLELVRHSQVTPPATLEDKRIFCERVNALLDLLHVRFVMQDGSLARLRLSETSKTGTIQFRTGQEGRKFVGGDSAELFPVPVRRP